MIYNHQEYYQDLYNDDYDNQYNEDGGNMFVGENRGASFFEAHGDDSCGFPRRISDDHQTLNQVQDVVPSQEVTTAVAPNNNNPTQ